MVGVEAGGAASQSLLCMHGPGGSAEIWAPLTRAFAGVRVVHVELPGGAGASLPESALSLDGQVAFIVALLDELGLDRAHVVAHSLGTVVAAQLAAQHPEYVRSLVLFGPLLAAAAVVRAGGHARGAGLRSWAAAGELPEPSSRGATSSATRATRLEVAALIRETLVQQPRELYARSCAALAAAPLALEAVAAPTLLVTGDEDPIVSFAAIRAMGARIRGSEVIVFRDCGHWPMLEKREESTAALLTFYREQQRALVNE